MLTFSSLGGAETVTGSKHLLRYGDSQVMVDCGLFQGLKNLREQNWDALPIQAKDVDAVVLTHGHLDHCGYLPRLVVQGFKGPVLASEATKEVAALILRDSAYLQEKDAEYANRKGFSKHHPAMPLYDAVAAERAISQIKPRPLHEPIALPGGASLTLRRAGHILGACTATIQVDGQTIAFSGDLGRYDDPVMWDPEPISHADYLVIESTYGNRRHEKTDPVEALKEVITRTIARGGTVVIPAFAVGRAQSLLYYLWRLRQQGDLANVPVYLDSPMATHASRLLYEFPEDIRLSAAEYEAVCASVQCVADVEESKLLSANRYPKVILSASGMATGGRVLHHLAAFLPDHRNTVLFSGYQAAGTRGRKVLQGEPDMKIHGQWVPVRAEVAELPMLSAHADSDELMRWMRGFKKPVKRVFIVHGESDASEALRVRIDRELGWDTVVPRQNQLFEL